MGQVFRFPRTVYPNLVYVVLLPVFFMTFCLVYNPFDIQGFYAGAGGKTSAFHLVMLSCIQLGVLALTRLVFFFLNRKASLPWWRYLAWCFFEICMLSAFMALYTTLFFGEALPFFPASSRCFKFALSILVSASFLSSSHANMIL